ncbi:MAG: class I SAM-dependent methyltransferase [Lentisphaerae bacterium]|nr:class I SAM-dependent methyltransferase [Lentisphaerota bacterium]
MEDLKDLQAHTTVSAAIDLGFSEVFRITDIILPGFKIDLYSGSYRDEVKSALCTFLEFMNSGGQKLSQLTLLDVGVGRGWSSYITAHFFGTVCGCDLDEATYATTGFGGFENFKHHQEYWKNFVMKRSNLLFSAFDGYHIPIASGSVDAVLAIAVLEHLGKNALNNDKRYEWLQEINRVLRPGGVFCISQCPNTFSFSERLARLFGLQSHKKLFSRKELVHLLNTCGFDVQLVKYAHPFVDFYPGRAQDVWNILYRMLFRRIGKLIQYTPFCFFFHHFTVISAKKIV